MRVLRLLGLLAVLGAAALASYLLHQRSLSDFFPAWLLALAPALYSLTRWLPADLVTLAFWLSGAAALGFGLLAPSWPLQAHGRDPAPRLPRLGRQRLALLFCALGVIAALSAALYLGALGADDWVVQALWAGAVLLYLIGCVLAAASRSRAITPAAAADTPVMRGRHGRLLLLLLVAVGILLVWSWSVVPPRLDRTLAAWGLQALALLHTPQNRLFTPSSTMQSAVPALMVAPLALSILLSGDVLGGVRAVGLVSGLMTVAGVWLLAGELLRRTPHMGPYGELIEDDGRSLALLAAALVASSPLFLHFSQLPFFLEPVAWGVMGLWALLRGLRTSDRLAVGLSGVLCGLAALLYPSGLVFPLVALGWWLGVWLLQPDWLCAAPETRGTIHRRGRLGLFWLGGLVVTMAPQLAAWGRDPARLLDQFGGSLWPRLTDLLVLLNLETYRGSALLVPAYGLSVVVAPILILAVGNLLLNLDRLAGWALFSWALMALAISSLLAPTRQFWPVFLPLLPALALMLAFTLDRIRATLLETAGVWLARATTYLLIGLVVWLSLLGWIEYRQFARTTLDPATATALELRRLGPGRTPVLLLGRRQNDVNWDEPTIRFLVGETLAPSARLTIEPTDWPATLPAGSTVLVQAGDSAWLAELPTHYPGGHTTVQRDGRGNPLLYRYELP